MVQLLDDSHDRVFTAEAEGLLESSPLSHWRARAPACLMTPQLIQRFLKEATTWVMLLCLITCAALRY